MSDVSLTLTIPLPCQMPQGIGINSTGAYGDLMRARVTRDEYMLVEREAAKLGLSVSMFTRWCAVHAASALEKRDARDDSPPSSA